ncbi:MAG: hypothetical protein GC186_18985 [Rhodobacteraceae bacterium]|nr:hypothetical protein [Paracoccaceae bacterium]
MPARLVCTLAMLVALPAAARDLRGPELGAASNFGQHWSAQIFAAAQALGVRNFRDAVYWDEVEQPGGRFAFTTMSTTYPALIAAADDTMSLTVNNGHPAYDGGVTPYTSAGIAAFARDAAETVKRFPAITAVEVGNEINSANFVTGPLKAAPLDQRALDYLAILRAVQDAVKAVNPRVRILGGGVHSIPVGYLAPMFAAGAASAMDALALHTYTTPAEQLVRQIAVFRPLPGAADLPLDVTEFGEPDPAKAPGLLLRNYCQMALAGVGRAVWYPLNPRGDGLTPLIDAAGKATATGRGFQQIAGLMERQPVANAAPDPFTYACLFGTRTLVIWGAPRALHLTRADLRATDPAGAALDPASLTLSETDPITITGSGPLALGTDVTLAPQMVIADSYDQFAYPGIPDQPADPFTRVAVEGDQVLPLETHGGQDRQGAPWTPYLGVPGTTFARLTADVLLPGTHADRQVVIVHRFTAPADMTVIAESRLAPASHSEDGIRFDLTLNGAPLDGAVLTTPGDRTTPPLHLKAGDVLAFAVGPNISPTGDATDYRFTLRRAE